MTFIELNNIIRAILPAVSEEFNMTTRKNLVNILRKEFFLKLLGFAETQELDIPPQFVADLKDLLKEYLEAAAPLIKNYKPSGKLEDEVRALKDGLKQIQVSTDKETLKAELKALLAPIPSSHATNIPTPKKPVLPKPVSTLRQYHANARTSSSNSSGASDVVSITQKIQKLSLTPLYAEGRSTADCVQSVGNAIQATQPMLMTDANVQQALVKFESNLNKAHQQSTRMPYTMLADDIDKLRRLTIDHVTKHLKPRTVKLLSRLNYGLLNIPELIEHISKYPVKAADLAEARDSMSKVIKALAYLQIYPLVRGSFKEGTNYISQPFSNLLEVVFECHLLGFEHKTKIKLLNDKLTSIVVELKKLESKLQCDNNTKQYFAECLLILECLKQIMDPILDQGYREVYERDNLSANNFVAWAETKLTKHHSLLKQIDALVESYPAFDIDKLYVDPDSPPALLTDNLHRLYQRFPVFSHVAADSSRPPAVVASVAHDFETEVANIVNKALVSHADIAEFLHVVPANPTKPVEQLQYLIFLTLHCAQLSNAMSLENFVQNIFTNTFAKNDTYETSYVETITTDDSQASLAVHTGQIGASNHDLPLLSIHGYYKDLILQNGAASPLDPGLGFHIVFKDSAQQILGALTCGRPDLDASAPLALTYGGSVGKVTDTLEQAVDAFFQREKNEFKKLKDQNIQVELNTLHAELKKLILSGSLRATILTRYKDKAKRPLYCYMSIEVPWVVRDLNEAQKIVALLNQHPEGRDYKITDYATLEDMYHHPTPQRRLLAKLGVKPFILGNSPSPAATSTISSSSTLFAGQNMLAASSSTVSLPGLAHK